LRFKARCRWDKNNSGGTHPCRRT